LSYGALSRKKEKCKMKIGNLKNHPLGSRLWRDAQNHNHSQKAFMGDFGD